MSTIWAFENTENKHTLYHSKDCMKNFCESWRKHAKNITDFEKQKTVTVKQRRTKITSRCKSMFCGKRFLKHLLMIKIIEKLETIVILRKI